MEENTSTLKISDPDIGKFGYKFWFLFLLGFGAALYLLLFSFVTANFRSYDIYTVTISYFEIVSSMHLVLLSISISKLNGKLTFPLSIVALFNIIFLIIPFGFNAFYNSPYFYGSPWAWHLSYFITILLAFPFNLLLVMMLAGALGLIFIAFKSWLTKRISE